MKLRITIVSLMAFALVAFLLTGCTDKTKDNPTAPSHANGLTLTHGFSSYAIQFSTFAADDSVMSETGFKPAKVYLPPNYGRLDNPDGLRFPVLYLLPPFGADEGYYFEHGLADVANRLISEGKIKPMIIVSFDGRSVLGGSFYANSARQGNFFTAMYKDTTFPNIMMSDETVRPADQRTADLKAENFLSKIDGTYRTIQNRRSRGIGGVGMGGYGAFLSAIKTDNFSSVSALDAPLDFDGTGSGGFLRLFNEVIPSAASWADMDTAGIHSPQTLLISAAAAFSPQETEIEVDSVYTKTQGTFVASHVVSTLTDDMRSYLPKHRVHLPLDSTASLNDFIWGKWMENNIDYLYLNEAVDAEHFRTMSKFLMRSNVADFHYDEQMDAFISFMGANDISYEEKTVTLPGGVHANVDYQMYDLLEDILIFHSENLAGEGDL